MVVTTLVVIRIFLLSLALVLVLFVAALVAGNKLLAAPGYRGPESDHFDGVRFYNLGTTDASGQRFPRP